MGEFAGQRFASSRVPDTGRLAARRCHLSAVRTEVDAAQLASRAQHDRGDAGLAKVPNTRRAVAADDSEASAVAAENRQLYRTAGTQRRKYLLSRPTIPQVDFPFIAGREEAAAIGTKARLVD